MPKKLEYMVINILVRFSLLEMIFTYLILKESQQSPWVKEG